MKELFLLDLPLEPMDQRYSNQWQKWFNESYKRNNINFATVCKDTKPSSQSSNVALAPGEFLNPFETTEHKCAQMRETIKWLKKTDPDNGPIAVFLHDGWFPGIEHLEYIASLKQFDLSIYAFWHAGSYDDSDMLGHMGMHTWCRGSEKTWFRLCRKIFVGTEYHRERLLSALGTEAKDNEKVIVTGCPVEVPMLGDRKATPKEKIVVWPHRISLDKHPETLDGIMRREFGGCKDIQFIRTKDLNLSKADYYDLLSRSRVALSTATHENFGIAMVEAAMLGCFPVAPDGLAYKETLSNRNGVKTLYQDHRQMISLIKRGLDGYMNYTYPHTELYSPKTVTNKICRAIQEDFV